MRCPSCNISFSEKHLTKFGEHFYAGKGISMNLVWNVHYYTCAECSNPVIILTGGSSPAGFFSHNEIVYPSGHVAGNRKAPTEVDARFADDFNEASLVLKISPKASAALSRRCLQNILRDKAGVKKGDLAKEIQQVIDSGKLPSYISEGIDAIRNVGNYAAHPAKSQSTGEIVDVELGEAEWSLEVLELLFDFYFVQPVLAQKKRDALNQKLKDMGKPEMK